MVAGPQYSSKDRDRVDLLKSPPSNRMKVFGKSPPLTMPTKTVGKDALVEVSETKKKKRKKRKKKWTKPEGKPKRPLSAYNIFFAQERVLMLGKDIPTAEQEEQKKRVHCKTHGKISFAAMARTIGAKWKALDSSEKAIFEDRARSEKARYHAEITLWKESQKSTASASGETDASDSGKTGPAGTPSMPIASTSPAKKSSSEPISGTSRAVSEPAAVSPAEQLAAYMNEESLLLRREVASANAIGTLLPSERTAPTLPPHRINDNGSNVMRMILEEENRIRCMSLLGLQSNPLADFTLSDISDASREYLNHHQFPELDQAFLSRHDMNLQQLLANPMDAYSGLRSPLSFNHEERSLRGNLQLPGTDGLSFREYHSRYLQVLEEYATILEIEERHKRMMGHLMNK
ncbi:unnamed protein product [Pseudo-nitzschia multistriata]|uniref:HMG box domain-containing protein n=1 Tax=Pseudo-nitzschia multistriata TaxID=183589 RepID=A0A448Z9U2_9STRA|nr:unnamed protein product [Pseudo-nitzschia multistriata]